MDLLTQTDCQELWDAWAEGLRDSCELMPATTSTSVIVRCAINQPTGTTDGDTGGSGRLGRTSDYTVSLPRGTMIATGYRLHWLTGAKRFKVGNVIEPGTYDPGILAQVVEVPS